MPKQAKAKRPIKLEFEFLKQKILMFSTHYELTAVDRITWLHVPLETLWKSGKSNVCLRWGFDVFFSDLVVLVYFNANALHSFCVISMYISERMLI